MDSSPPEITIEEATPRYSKRRKERAKTCSPPSSPVAPTRHFSPKQQHVSSPAITIEEAERSLSELIDDFERGKLQAFGSPKVVERMQEIRTMQERLTRRHFELDRNRVNRKSTSVSSSSKKLEPYSEMAELTQELEQLTKAIQSLHTETQYSAPSSRGRSPVPTLNITSTPYGSKHPSRELFATPVGLPDGNWADQHDSLSSPTNSRDEVDFDYPLQMKDRKSSHASSSSSAKQETTKDRKYSHTSTSSSVKQETIV